MGHQLALVEQVWVAIVVAALQHVRHRSLRQASKDHLGRRGKRPERPQAAEDVLPEANNSRRRIIGPLLSRSADGSLSASSRYPSWLALRGHVQERVAARAARKHARICSTHGVCEFPR